MSNVTITPNMSLPTPIVGVDPGPDWATNYNACMSAIDSHNHSAGQGVQINPNGLNINADLPMNINNLITTRSLRFTPSTVNGAADLGCLYESGVDLFYVDGSGNQIRITQSGSLAGAAGTITGLPSGTASASFAAGTFTFQSATNTPAAMNVGSVKVTQIVANGKGVTISAAGAQAADYNLALPVALPGATSFVTLDGSGNIGATIATAGGLTPQYFTYNYAASASCGSYSQASMTFTGIANLTVTLTNHNNNPIRIMMVPDGTTNAATILSTTGNNLQFLLVRDGVSHGLMGVTAPSTGAVISPFIQFIDFPANGAHTYILQVAGATTNTFNINNFILVAVEGA